METRALKEIGMSENEIAIYRELLKEKEALASTLSKSTGINRTLVYQLLTTLLHKGLVSYVIKNNVKYFKAAHPSKILDYLKEKELSIQTIIPELIAIAPKNGQQYTVELYEGKDGLKTIMNDILQSNAREWLDFTSGRTIDILPDYFMDQWEKRRIKAKIKTRFLINDTAEGRKRGKQLQQLPISGVKYLPKGLNSPSHIYIYGHKVGIALWEKEHPFGILIESKEIANRFKEFFEWFWLNAKE